MAHLYNNHGVTITNPDDVGFTDYLSESDVYGNADYLSGIISDDERPVLQTALNVHLHHHDANKSLELVGHRNWKFLQTLT